MRFGGLVLSVTLALCAGSVGGAGAGTVREILMPSNMEAMSTVSTMLGHTGVRGSTLAVEAKGEDAQLNDDFKDIEVARLLAAHRLGILCCPDSPPPPPLTGGWPI